MPIKFRRPSIKVDKYPDNSRLVIIFSSTNFLLFLIKLIDFIDCYRMLSIIDFIDCKCQAVTHSPSARLPPFSGAPKRVNLFSFGCHVIDRAYVRTYVRVYRLYGWGRGDYQKKGSSVMANPHLLYWAFTTWTPLVLVMIRRVSIGTNRTIGTNGKAPYSNGSVGEYASH